MSLKPYVLTRVDSVPQGFVPLESVDTDTGTPDENIHLVAGHFLEMMLDDLDKGKFLMIAKDAFEARKDARKKAGEQRGLYTALGRVGGVSTVIDFYI